MRPELEVPLAVDVVPGATHPEAATMEPAAESEDSQLHAARDLERRDSGLPQHFEFPLSSSTPLEPVALSVAAVRHRGRVNSTDRARGYGFIVDQRGVTWFFHRRTLSAGMHWASVKPGLEVEFSAGWYGRGPCAVDVAPAVVEVSH